MAKCIQIGEAGVLRVMSELIFRGHHPYKPAVDDHGVDLMLSTGLRIQVKTATLITRQVRIQRKEGIVKVSKASYNLRLGSTQSGRVHAPINRKKAYSQECDYFVIFGVDESRFWIVPSFVMDNRTCLVLGPRPAATRQQVMELADQGLGLNTIADQLGMCPVSIWKRKRSDIQVGGFVRAVRMCEDRWDFLSAPPEVQLAANRTREQEIQQLEKMLATTVQK
jgi:hypothetical protein